ncbi:hypothetical protein PGB90_000049 [Kerria lacca]
MAHLSENKALLLTDDGLSQRLSYEQIICTILIMMPTIPTGMSNAFSAIALPQLNLTLIETSWFAGLPTLAAITGNLITGLLIDRCGRKITFLLNSISSMLGCLFLSTSTTITNLYIGQFFCGMSTGIASISPIIYIVESVVSDNLYTRNSFASWNMFSSCLGMSLDFVASLFYNYQQVAVLCGSLSFIFMILFIVFIPESPVWLYQKGRYNEAWFARKKLNFGKNLNNYKSDPITFTRSTYSGYKVNIIKPKFLPVDPYQLSAICGFIPLIGIATYSLISPHTGLKKICMLSSFSTSITTFIVGLTVWVHAFSISAGLGTAPYAIVGEIFPENVKGIACIPVLTDSLFYFLIIMLFPFASKYYPYQVHFLFSLVSFISIIFIYYFVPETVAEKNRKETEMSDIELALLPFARGYEVIERYGIAH